MSESVLAQIAALKDKSTPELKGTRPVRAALRARWAW
jgi:hypothetical protein